MIRTRILIEFFALLCFSLISPRVLLADETVFSPADWVGTWQGPAVSRKPDGTMSSFSLQLTIAPDSKAGQWKWNIIFEDANGKIVRPYVLVEVESRNGHFVIDEQNGVKLDAVRFGNTLSSHFQVADQTLWSTYRFQSQGNEQEIQFELFSATSSGSETSQVISQKATTRQFAVLKRTQNETSSAPKSSNQSNWVRQDTESYRGKQDDIFFVNDQIGWYVNGAGKIFKTIDGGKAWQQQLHLPGTFFRCIAFLDEKHGFAGNIGPGYFPNVTDDTPLYETMDGGTTWTKVASIEGSLVGLCSIQVLDEPFINAGKLDSRKRVIGVGRVGGPAAMIISDDLGKSWQRIEIPADAGMLLDVHFFNRNEGFLAAATNVDVAKSNALVLRTKDGGKTWQQAWRSNRPFELTWKMSFPTQDVGYVTIQSYNPDPSVKERFIAKTIDGGRTWSEVPLVSDAAVREFGVGFVSKDYGWVGATPHGFETTDGGQSWKKVEMGNAVNKIRILKTDQGHVGFAIGVNVHRIDVPN